MGNCLLGNCQPFGLGFHTGAEDVDEDRRHDDRADDDLLEVRGHAQEVAAIADDLDEERAYQGAPDVAPAAVEGSAEFRRPM